MPLNIEMLSVTALRPRPKNARTHSRKQSRQIADSIERFGFTAPVLIDGEHMILASHADQRKDTRPVALEDDWTPP